MRYVSIIVSILQLENKNHIGNVLFKFRAEPMTQPGLKHISCFRILCSDNYVCLHSLSKQKCIVFFKEKKKTQKG